MPGQVVLPGGADVERARLQLPGPDLVVPAAPGDPDRLEQIRQGRDISLVTRLLLVLRGTLRNAPIDGSAPGW